MKRFIAEASFSEGYNKSRLPAFTDDESDYIKGTYDFFAVNYYSTYLIESADNENSYDFFTKKSSDSKSLVYQDEKNWPGSVAFWLKVTLLFFFCFYAHC